jgi:hypothetical protein
MVRRVAVALIATRATSHDARFDRGADDAEVGLRLAGDHVGDRVANVGAVEVESNAAHQLRHARLPQACVGTARARGPTVEALIDATQEQVAVKTDGPRVPVNDLSHAHISSESDPPQCSLESSFIWNARAY